MYGKKNFDGGIKPRADHHEQVLLTTNSNPSAETSFTCRKSERAAAISLQKPPSVADAKSSGAADPHGRTKLVDQPNSLSGLHLLSKVTR